MNTRPLVIVRVLGLALLLGGCAGKGQPKMDWSAPQPVQPALAAPTAGAIYQAGVSRHLYADRKARQVGDILTVLLIERTSAAKQSSTATSKDADLGIGAPTLFGGVLNGGEMSLDAQRSFSGSGSSNQSNQLDGKISVTVHERRPGGLLLIRGQKRLALNQGEELIRIQGLVREVDITPSNTIASSQIADARIVYSGKGELASANTQGWASRFFNSKWFPF